MALHRRDFLCAGAAVAASAVLPQFTRVAEASTPGKNLIIVLNTGGWDTTYTLDPKPGVAGIDGPASGTVQHFGNVAVLTDPSRPNVGAFFQRYASMCAVINGIQMRSFIHPDCTKRIMTGGPSDTSPDVGAICGYELGRDMPVPYLVLGSSALSGPLAAITGRAGTTNQISALLGSDPLVPPPAFTPSADDDLLTKKYLDATAARVTAIRGQRGSNAKQLDAFVKSLDRADLLRGFAKTQGGFGQVAYTPQLSVQVSVGTTALQGGLSHAVMMETTGWDTHSNDPMQGQLANELYGGLTTLADQLVAKNLMSNTVVLVLSEMGRTPRLNPANGKDHWPVTSALVFGAGVAGNRVLGGTDDKLGALSMSMKTGMPDPNGVQLQTGNLVAGVLDLIGVDPSNYFPGVEPFDAIKAS